MYGYNESLPLNYLKSKVTIFSLCWPLVLLHHVWNGFLFASSHGLPISAGFQLTLLLGLGRPGPFFLPSCKPVPGRSGSRQLPTSLLGTIILVFLSSMDINRGHAACPCSLDVIAGKQHGHQHVYAACPSRLSPLHVPAACPC